MGAAATAGTLAQRRSSLEAITPKAPMTIGFPMALTGIRVRRDNWVSVMYAEGLNSAKSSVPLQRTDRQGIVVRQIALKRK